MRGLQGFLLMVALVSAACTSSTPPAKTSPPPSQSSLPSTSPPVAPPPRWQAIAPAPIAGRISEGVVWTGSQMIVWGGVARTSETSEQAGDGAAYDPASDSWKKIAPAPAGLKGGGGQAAAWTGSEAVFWVGNSPDGPVGGAVYDPAPDSWRTLPAGPLGIREGYVSVWTGKRLLIVGGVAGDQLATPIGAGVNPSTGSWRPLAGLNKLTGFLPTGAVWDGKEAFLFGNTSQCPELGAACRKYTPTFVSYAPSTDSTQQISLKDVPVGQKALRDLVAAAWTGSEVLFTNALDTSAPPVLYDPVADTWRVGPRAPCAPTEGAYSQTAWIGAFLVAPCGKGRTQLYDPAADTWQTLATGPSPLNSRSSSAIVWTGTQLIVWSGMPYRTGNPALKTGAIIDLSGVQSSAG